MAGSVEGSAVGRNEGRSQGANEQPTQTMTVHGRYLCVHGNRIMVRQPWRCRRLTCSSRADQGQRAAARRLRSRGSTWLSAAPIRFQTANQSAPTSYQSYFALNNHFTKSHDAKTPMPDQTTTGTTASMPICNMKQPAMRIMALSRGPPFHRVDDVAIRARYQAVGQVLSRI